MIRHPLQGFVKGNARSALHTYQLNFPCHYATVYSLSVLHLSQWSMLPADVHRTWRFACSAVWLQTITCHSHHALQLSSLVSSCRARPRLPSGLLCLPHLEDSIMPSQLKSKLNSACAHKIINKSLVVYKLDYTPSQPWDELFVC